MAKAGRPSSYTYKVATLICERMIEGESLVEICSGKDMPNRATVYRWLAERPEFATNIARAREGLAEYQDQLIARIARDCTPETAAADRVKLAALQWRAGKLAPRRYGDRVTQELTGPNDGPIQVSTSAAHDKLGALVARAADDAD